MRPIDADALLVAIKGDIMGGLNYERYIREAPTLELPEKQIPIAVVRFDEEKLKELTDQIVEKIKSGEIYLQTDPERPKGTWILHIDDLFPAESTEECPFCHEEQSIWNGNDDNFCPNCGADLRGTEDEE
jgi:hypothetical protein